MIEFEVFGKPAPQGSKRAFVNRKTGRAQVVDDSKATLPWREAVKHAAREAICARCEGLGKVPVAVTLTFYLARPQSHFRTGKNAHLMRDAAPTRPTTKPDLDKLVRSTCDALTDAGVYHDDSCVVAVVAVKQYADHRPPGLTCLVEEA